MTATGALDDGSLAERIRFGDGTALGELYDRYASAAMADAMRVVTDRQLAQDLVHNAFVSAWRTIDRFDASRTRLRPWLMAIVRNAVEDLVPPEPDPAPPAPGSPQSDDATADRRARELRAALGSLPAAQRRALELACLEGRSYGEIATLTGVTEGTVLTRLREAVVTIGNVVRMSDEHSGTIGTALGSPEGARDHAAVDRGPFRILVVDDDTEVCEVVTATLGDEGYEVVTLGHVTDDAVSAAIGRVDPDCILLDGAQAVEYAEGWVTAADIRRRARPIPTVMFTAHHLDAAEAAEKISDRAVAAGFVAVLRKPFELDELVVTVDRAIVS